MARISVRKGTKAAEMPQIPYEIKQNRIKRLIARQNEITEEISKDYVGNVYEILVEGMQEKKNGLCPARQLQCRPAQGRKPYNFRGTTQIAGCTACRFGVP